MDPLGFETLVMDAGMKDLFILHIVLRYNLLQTGTVWGLLGFPRRGLEWRSAEVAY